MIKKLLHRPGKPAGVGAAGLGVLFAHKTRSPAARGGTGRGDERAVALAHKTSSPARRAGRGRKNEGTVLSLTKLLHLPHEAAGVGSPDLRRSLDDEQVLKNVAAGQGDIP